MTIKKGRIPKHPMSGFEQHVKEYALKFHLMLGVQVGLIESFEGIHGQPGELKQLPDDDAPGLRKPKLRKTNRSQRYGITEAVIPEHRSASSREIEVIIRQGQVPILPATLRRRKHPRAESVPSVF